MLPRIYTIKQIRIKLGITQKNLAGMAGVSTSMINQIESGRSQPSYETAKTKRKIAKKPKKTTKKKAKRR